MKKFKDNIPSSTKIELKKWKMIRQQYINKLSNYMGSGFTLIPHDKAMLERAECEVTKLEGRKVKTFEDIKANIKNKKLSDIMKIRNRCALK